MRVRNPRTNHKTKVQTEKHVAIPNVKVKVERGDTDDGDEGDKDHDGGDDRNHERDQAKRVYENSVRFLKFKLYFEDFFPTDDDRGALIYDCWMDGANVTKGLTDDCVVLERMLYRFKYDKKARVPPLSLYPLGLTHI